MRKMWWEYFKWKVCKIKNYLSKMKELDQSVLQKGLFVSVKGHLCLKKKTLGLSRRTGWVWPPSSQKLFLISFIYIKKKNFFKKGTFKEVSNARKFYLSKISPGRSRICPWKGIFFGTPWKSHAPKDCQGLSKGCGFVKVFK